jgi:tetratricopeptide (TPR) repeat protein
VKNCPPREQRRKVNDVHDLIEAIWQYCQARNWQEAYHLMEQEKILEDLNDWRDYATLQELCELLLPLEKWHAKPLQEARIYSILGESYRILGKIEDAQKYLQWALTKYKELGVRSEEGLTLLELGRIYSDIGKIKQAGECFEAALATFKEVGDILGEGRALRNLGWVYYLLGYLEDARLYYEKALSIFNKVVLYTTLESSISDKNNMIQLSVVFCLIIINRRTTSPTNRGSGAK